MGTGVGASFAPARDHVRLVIEPERAVLAQHFAGGVQVAAVVDRAGEPRVLDLRDVDRRVPGREQGRGASYNFV